MLLAGLCPYAYIFLAAQSPTRGSWGDTASLKGGLFDATMYTDS